MAGGGERGEHRHMKAPKSASTIDSSDGHLRFKVELHPVETTIFSWKNLLREANLIGYNSLRSSMGPSFEPQITFALYHRLPSCRAAVVHSYRVDNVNGLDLSIQQKEKSEMWIYRKI